MASSPDFFLDLTEAANLAELRACYARDRLKDNSRDDYMLVNVDPPIFGQKYGMGGKEISHVLLATRHRGYTLFPVTEWPAFVYVTRILDESILATKSFTANQVELISWGVLYRSEAEARSKSHANS